MNQVKIKDFRQSKHDLEQLTFPLIGELRTLEFEIGRLRSSQGEYESQIFREERAHRLRSGALEKIKTALLNHRGILDFFSWSYELSRAGFFANMQEVLLQAHKAGLITTSDITFTNFETLRRLAKNKAYSSTLIDSILMKKASPEIHMAAKRHRNAIESNLELAVAYAIEDFYPKEYLPPEIIRHFEITDRQPELDAALERHRALGLELSELQSRVDQVEKDYKTQVTELIKSRAHLANLDSDSVQKMFYELRGTSENQFIDLSLDTESFLEIVEYLVGAASTKVCAMCFQLRNTSEFDELFEHAISNHFFVSVANFKMKVLVGIERSWNFFMLSPKARERLLSAMLAEACFEDELFEFYFQVKPIDSDMPPTRADIQRLESSVLPQMAISYDQFRDALQAIKDEFPKHRSSVRSYVQFVSRQTKPHILKAIASFIPSS
jgi:hypothetical protein